MTTYGETVSGVPVLARDAPSDAAGAHLTRAGGIFNRASETTMTKTHVLKSFPEHWDAQANNTKTFELRVNDREYAVGDILQLHRNDGSEKPRAPLLRRVTHMTEGELYFNDGPVLLPDGVVIMSTAPVTAAAQSPDQMMVAHLRACLESVRDQLAVEGGTETFKKHTARYIASMVNEIDEALAEDDPT